MSRNIKYFTIGCVVLIYFLFQPLPNIYNSACLAIILLFGIPHGAADHRINGLMHKNANMSLFILKYLLISAGFVFWWILMPGKALVIFLILSAYHFGQEFLEEIGILNQKLWEIMIWGSVILFAPIFIAYQEVKPILDLAGNVSFPEFSPYVLIVMVTVIIGSAVAHLMFLIKNKKIQKVQVRRLIEMIVFTMLMFSLLPFLMAFTIYFILFHSINSFKHQFNWIKERSNRYTLKSFFKDLSLFSILSIFGLVVFIYFLNPDSLEELTSYFFILVSVITLPHSIVFDQFYKNRKKSARLIS